MTFAAYSIREDAKAGNFSATPVQVSLALNALIPSVQSHHAQIFVVQTRTPETEQDSQYLIRRYSPLEAERLMGWPDCHTLHRADGKTNSDRTRFKMCGNGVVAPVAKWIAEQLKPLLEEK